MKLFEYDKIVNKNKISGKNWYHGLEGKWWWGMSENHARKYLVKSEEDATKSIEDATMKKEKLEKLSIGKIVLASTWNVRCGIATYTKYLLDHLNRIKPSLFIVDALDQGELEYKSRGNLTHLQHEFGIVPKYSKLKINGKLIITWHTVSKHINHEIERFESKFDVVAHIIHSERMRHKIDSSKDVWVVPHGSIPIPQMSKEDARRALGINNINMPIGFVFGFQSGDKNYQRLIDAAKNTGIHIIISGARHKTGYSLDIQNNQNVTFINRFIDENDVSLYAMASDMLLFDYVGKDHYSVSGAMHRIIGAGIPVICSDIKHFCDVHRTDCLKFNDRHELEKCMIQAIEHKEQFGLAARRYAEKTSWENVAKMHMEIYGKYTHI